MRNIQFTVALDKKNLNRLNLSLKSDNGKCTELVYQYVIEDIDNQKIVNLLQYTCAHNYLKSEEIVSKKEKKSISSETNSLLDAINASENRLRTRWEFSKLQYKLGLKILDKAVPKETVERTMELTFDFVRSLIDDKEKIDNLPEQFTLQFVEKSDLILIEERKKADKKYNKETNIIYVRVINTFEIV